MTREWMVNAVAEHQAQLRTVALGITRHYDRAEEIVAQCTVSALEQIADGKCKATSEGQFFAWLRTMVRRNAMRLVGQAVYNGAGNADIQPTAGDRNYRRAHPSRELLDELVIDSFHRGHGEGDHRRTVGRSKLCPHAE